MRSLLRILSYIKHHKRRAIVGYSFVALAAGSELLLPWLTKIVIDQGLIGGQHVYLVYSAAAIVVVSIIAGVFIFARSYYVEALAQSISYDIRNEAYSHLLRLSFSYYDKAQTGQLMSRLTDDVEAIRRFVTFGMRNVVNLVLLVFGIGSILFFIHWRLAIVSMVLLPLVGYRAFAFGRRLRPLYSAVQQQFAVLVTRLQENIAGARVVRVFAREEQEIRRFELENEALLNRNMAAVRLWALNVPLMSFLTGLSTALILWYGGREVISGAISIGTLVAFNSYLSLLISPVRQIGWIVNLAARAIASGQRIFEVLDTSPAISEEPHPRALDNIRGEVVLDHVSFSYDGSGPILQDIDIRVNPGEAIAILGPTGAGKSTLVNMLARFYDPTSGAVLLDGVDLRELSLEQIRKNVGIVQQDSFLFSMSVRENIALGCPGADVSEIEMAARAAQAHGFITALPGGYDTVVGERGLTLSGGQRQRITIARTILMNPPVLVLDDSTSSVDLETEQALRLALSEVMKGRATLVITQRVSTAIAADRIVVLDRGRIESMGTHADLLQRSPIYRRFYDLQNGPGDYPAGSELEAVI